MSLMLVFVVTSVPSLKFVGLPVRKTFDIYCVRINPLSDLDL